MELLGAGIDVMKMQRAYTAVVAAERAATPGFSHEDALYLASALTYPLHTTPLASVVAATLQPKLSQAMPATPPYHGGLAGSLRRARGPLSKLPVLSVGL
jgi:hypothetical protein